MTSLAKIAANRANARKSTGPRTAAGKARAARNAQKSTGPKSQAGKKRVGQNAVTHGLTRPASCEPDAPSTISDFARAVTKQIAEPELLPTALRMAAAQFDLLRVRRARRRLFAGPPRDLVRRLAALERYVAHAQRQRKTAIRELENAEDLRDQSELSEPKSDKTK
jgi:hypothetical protein